MVWLKKENTAGDTIALLKPITDVFLPVLAKFICHVSFQQLFDGSDFDSFP